MLSKSAEEEKVEPKENDKCMENNEHDKDNDSRPQPSRFDELGKRAKVFASNRYNIVIVLLCVLLFIFFIIIIALAVQLGSYDCPRKEECHSAECLSASALVVARSDISYDPCTDFWSYSCKGWLDRNPLPHSKGSLSVKDKLQEEIYSRIRHLIDLVPYNADFGTPEWKVKKFYSSCVNLEHIESWVPEKFNHAIHELGGWSIINNPPGSQWQRNDVLRKLQVTYGVNVFFKIVVEPDDTDPKRNIIKLLPDGFGLPSRNYYSRPQDDPYVVAYKKFIKNLIQEMGVTLFEANRFAEDMFHYEKRLADITPDPETLRNTKENYRIMTVYELDRLSTTISWIELLQTYFPGLIQSETHIAVQSEKYFSAISRLISSTDDSVLNNYFMWRLLFTYVPHLSSKFTMVANNLKQTFEGVHNMNLQSQERWEFCMKLTSHYLGHAVGAMYVKHYFPKEAEEEIQVYIHRIVGALSGITNIVPWLEDATSHEKSQEKIHNMLLLVGYPKFAQNHTLALQIYYNELRVQSDYLQNIKDGVYFLHKKQEEMLKRKHSVPDDSWTIYPHDVIANYKYAGNHLIVPAGLLEAPLFEFGSPLAVKYGILSGHVANKMSQIFDDKGINYEMDGILKSWMSNKSMDTYHQKQECLKTALSNYSLHNVEVDPDSTLGTFIADIGGVKLAYEAFKSHIEDIGEIGQLPGISINDDQLFFISYAQSLCQAIRPGKLKAQKDASQSLPEELRVLGTLQQLPEFASAFSCPKGSVMNPYSQCQMW